MKRTLFLLISLVMVLFLSACSGGIKNDDAKEHVNGFFDAVKSEDYELASTFLHPERPTDLKTFFDSLKSQENLDFSNIEIEKYTGFSSSLYDSTVNGAAYSLNMTAIVSEKDIQIEIEIVKNDNGYGIYNFNINPQ